MGKFANNKCPKYFAIIMGFVLFAINAFGLIPDDGKQQIKFKIKF